MVVGFIKEEKNPNDYSFEGLYKLLCMYLNEFKNRGFGFEKSIYLTIEPTFKHGFGELEVKYVIPNKAYDKPHILLFNSRHNKKNVENALKTVCGRIKKGYKIIKINRKKAIIYGEFSEMDN